MARFEPIQPRKRRPLAEVFEEIVQQVRGFVLGIKQLEHVVGTLIGEVGR